LRADYHVHTPYCGHAHGKIVQYIESAIAAGIDEIGFADHLGRYYLTQTQRRRYWDWGMNERDITRYFTELSELKEIYENQIKIRIGLEVDYIEGAEDMLVPLLEACPFDFSLGSIHCLPKFGWKHLADYKEEDTIRFYNEYFRTIRLAIESKLFSSIAHTDFIWRHIKWPSNLLIEILYKELEKVIETAFQNGGILEVNANGYIWSKMHNVNGYDPYDYFLELIGTNGVGITLGSDAHEPGLVGKSFSELISVLKEKSITMVSCFSEGKEKKLELS
jgi:histidinol-phosphatase (PHP family)